MTSLIAVRAALKTSASEHATLFASLIDNGKLAHYKSKEALKRKLGLTGADQLWYPSLGKKQAPAGLRKLPSIKELQEICLHDLPEAQEYFGDRLIYFAQSGIAEDAMEMSEEYAGMQTINNLTRTDLDATEAIVMFPSEALEKMCMEGYKPPENLLRTAMTTCTVLPSDTLLSLHHSNEGTTVTTLLSGSVIWLIWPPTDHNRHTLQTAYENFAEDSDETKLDVANNLEGGMVFVQAEGDGLRIPPFCPMMSLATKTSVLAINSHITVENFISTLGNLPLLKAWYQTEVNGDRKLSDSNASILRYLDLMLNGDADDEDRDKLKLHFTKGGLLDTLLNLWDNIKNDLAAMMGPAESETMEKIWEAFLIAAKGRECWICDKTIRNKQKLMKNHFVDKHWAKVRMTKRIDSIEALDEEQGGAEFAGTMGRTELISAEDEDAMEVDV